MIEILQGLLDDLKAIEETGREFQRVTRQKLMEVLRDIIVRYCGIKDGHTLRILRRLGHPYAVRHSISEAEQLLGHAFDYIHSQSGTLVSRAQKLYLPWSRRSHKAHFEFSPDLLKDLTRYSTYVVEGTKYMHGRDPFSLYFELKGREEIARKIDEAFAETFGSGKLKHFVPNIKIEAR